MTHFSRTLLALAPVLLAAPAAAQVPRLLPLPAEMHEGQGALAVSGRTKLVVPAGDAGARSAAERFAALLAQSRGLKLSIASSDTAGAVRFFRANTGKAESYRLEVTPRGAVITAGDDAGLLYGAVTLWQAMTQAPGKGAVSIPAFGVTDAPRFGWRGLMLDSARHFQSPAYVRRLIDWMAVNKLNTLHWHLVDDQGWRVEIKKYPKLTEVSGWRHPATAVGAPQLPKIGGYYSQDEIRSIVAYAAQQNITIIPEIEMPGHALAAIRAYPELGTGVPIPPGTESDWGVFPWLYNFDDKTFGFLQDVLDEVIALFPSRYIHVGGDEATKEQWKGSPVIQAQIKALGLKDENALQAAFMHRIGEHLTKRGRKLIGWDEILEGGEVPPDATITSWRGVEGAITAARAGHDAVLSPSPTLYFDHRQGSGDSEPPGRMDVMDLRTIYNFEPIPGEVPAAQQYHILGLQANLWTEHVRTEDRATWMLFPRAAAIAEVGWSAKAPRDYGAFVDRLVPQLDRMGKLGLRPASSAFAITPNYAYEPGSAGATVSLANQSGLEIRYTVDGSPVRANSPVYSGPVAVKFPAKLNAVAYSRGRQLPGGISETVTAQRMRWRSDEMLKTCTNRVVLALEDDYPAVGKRAVFLTDLFNPCWQWETAPVGGARQIAITVGQIPFNFQVGKDIDSIKFAPPATPEGEFEVRAGTCEGPRVAVLPLAPAVGNPGLTRLVGALAPRSGSETLCIRYTAKGVEPIWAVDAVELIP
ncbi:family 20 glycosylhydrolase [Sphingomonas psychrotolerans]|uniref:beta-N-acetylhexosaminidase n=1 Tax=Sphingomonas psychrotolerans TaxID=1327635 RepID=A0ABU3MYU6_9SPHN|nr:family 20 glycosylhydrolase [Sphingomonas psychrotolerans]MDT8757402.1 family 20 glycosylhydrolase [Sphingomonas psychrotolerans]